MTEKKLLHIYVQFMSSNCTAIISPCIYTLQNRESSRSTIKSTNWRKFTGPALLTPLATAIEVAPPALPALPDRPDRPDHLKNFGEWSWRLLNERAVSATSTDNTRMVIVKDIPAEAEPPPHPDSLEDKAFYIKLRATLEVIFVSVWDVFIQKYQFNKLDNCMSKLKKCQNMNKSAE